MTHEPRSWMPPIFRQEPLPAALGIGLGSIAFIAGLLEPITLSNRKIMLGLMLVIGGLLYRAWYDWRFHSSRDRWFRSIFCGHSLAVILWAIALVLIVWLASSAWVPWCGPDRT